MRCKHERLFITEYGGWVTEHSREDGEWSNNSIPGHYNTRLDVYCRDCGLNRTYWRNSKRLPAWLVTALDQLGI